MVRDTAPRLARPAGGSRKVTYSLPEPVASEVDRRCAGSERGKSRLVAEALSFYFAAQDQRALAVLYGEAAQDPQFQAAKARVQFKQPVAEFQGMQFLFADMATSLEAARALTYEAARRMQAGDSSTSHFCAMAKLFASDMAMKVTVDAVQALGGYGVVTDHPVERMMRDAKILQIFDGTNQIQRMIIARGLLR
jgi:alkylation response protein AidB-like acyl-CoA dehydrogenase